MISNVFTLFAAFAAIAYVRAQVPLCGQPCVQPAIVRNPCDSIVPNGCLCAVLASNNSIADCILASCSEAEQEVYNSIISRMCSSITSGNPTSTSEPTFTLPTVNVTTTLPITGPGGPVSTNTTTDSATTTTTDSATNTAANTGNPAGQSSPSSDSSPSNTDSASESNAALPGVVGELGIQSRAVGVLLAGAFLGGILVL